MLAQHRHPHPLLTLPPFPLAPRSPTEGFHTEECFGTLKFVTDNHLSLEELKKLVDQKKHQARDIVAYFEEHQTMDPVGLKALLNGINAAKETHDAAQKRRERQQQQMQSVYDYYDGSGNGVFFLNALQG